MIFPRPMLLQTYCGELFNDKSVSRSATCLYLWTKQRLGNGPSLMTLETSGSERNSKIWLHKSCNRFQSGKKKWEKTLQTFEDALLTTLSVAVLFCIKSTVWCQFLKLTLDGKVSRELPFESQAGSVHSGVFPLSSLGI